MWRSLKDFYSSKEWIDCKRKLFVDRENDNGELICEHCHKPINRDDLIVHHKIYLNLDNVNDFNISLNPEHLALVHHKCHNEIHDRWGVHNQHIYLVYGPPLAGKTTWVNTKATKDDLIIDIDNIREAISGAKRYERSGYTNHEVFALYNLLMDSVKHSKAKNIFIVGGFPHARKREELCNATGAEQVYVECTKEECMFRLETKGDGRDRAQWKKYIDDWFFQYNF